MSKNCYESETTHERLKQEIAAKIPDDEKLFDLADFFKLFGDSTRMKILYALMEAESCVCVIAETLNTSVSAVSHQLKILRTGGLVKSRKQGKSVFYSLADSHVETILSQGMEHIEE